MIGLYRSGRLKLDELINLCIPRGGEGLIRAVAEKSRYCPEGSPPPLKTTTSTPGGSRASSRMKMPIDQPSLTM